MHTWVSGVGADPREIVTPPARASACVPSIVVWSTPRPDVKAWMAAVACQIPVRNCRRYRDIDVGSMAKAAVAIMFRDEVGDVTLATAWREGCESPVVKSVVSSPDMTGLTGEGLCDGHRRDLA